MVYDAKNNSRAFSAYVQRKDYKESAWQPEPTWPSPIDLWYNKTFYGRLDVHGNAIFVNDKYVKKVDTKSDTNTLVLNFVAEAFKDLKEYYAIAANTGQIETKDTNLLLMEAKNGWLSVNKEHIRHMKILFSAFNSTFLTENSRDKKITSFETFLPIFKEYLQLSLPDLPFTKTGFISSEFCSPMSSGLIIEIANGRPGDDNEKYRKFLSDPNFTFYTLAAKKFGFKVDKNLPWRLVADVGSPAMLKYMEMFPKAPQLEPPELKNFYVGDTVNLEELWPSPKQNESIAATYQGDPKDLTFVIKNIGINDVIYLEPGEVVKQTLFAETARYKTIVIQGIKSPSQLIMHTAAHNSPARMKFQQEKQNYIKVLEDYLKIPKLSLDSLFSRCYYKSYKYDIELLKVYVLEFYNSHVLTSPTITKVSISKCYNQQSTKKVIQRHKKEKESLRNEYDDLFWIKFYTDIRIAEIRWKITEPKRIELMNRIKAVYYSHGSERALHFANLSLRGILTPKKKVLDSKTKT